MNTSTQQLYDEAMRLSASDRAELASLLIESLDPEVDTAIHAAWDAEIKSRIDQLDRDAVTTVPWPEARRMILGTSDAPSSD
ncbi:MAG: addiction module protein [Pirellulaceae bacterium]|jgi:putative addiction module component (TIGR02574 family)|nr:addiction module protein [Pirellulaceae bacterium]MDP7014259.1 addiction module protein [Pirellulaceae bacterium]